MAYNTGSKPWNRLTWSDETMQMIYREWGKFCGKRNIMDKAAFLYEKSMLVNQYDAGCLQNRSLAFLQIAKTDRSLQDSTAALALKKRDSLINLQYSEALFYNNQFEECLSALHNNSRKFQGGKLKPFKEKISILDTTFDQCLSSRLGTFALKNHKTFLKVGKMISEEAGQLKKMRWKKLLDEGKCDVESIEILPEELLHLREYERRKLAYKVTNQKYIGRSWADLIFLSKLRFDKTLLLKQTPVSTKQLLNQVEEKFDEVTKFVKMLHARDPLYNLKLKNCPDVILMEKIKQSHLFRIQSQTRRDMFNFLHKIKELRRKKKIIELRTYIQDVMGNYTIIKTKKVMPWKFEFMSEVYNVMALAYLDQLKVPDDIMDYKLEFRLCKILGIEPLKEKESKRYVFGDKSTFIPPDAIDYEYIAYKQRVTQLEKWLEFSKNQIEKSFIYNLISHYHLEHSKLEDCVQYAIKGRNVARNIDNTVWTLLCILQIIKAQTLQKKYDGIAAHYSQAINLIKKFKEADNILLVLQMAQTFNNQMRTFLKTLRKKATKK